MGETFPVFAPHRTDAACSPYTEYAPDLPRLSAEVLLDLDPDVPPIPFLFATIGAWKAPTQAFTPAAPELGYHVTWDDFDPEARLAKLESLEAVPPSDIPGHPYLLGAFTSTEDLWRLGLLERHPTYEMPVFRRAILPLMAALRLQVQVNGYRFESQPDLGLLEAGELAFHRSFYPLDTGPLPVPPSCRFLFDPGLLVALPADPTMLQTVAARFRLTAN